MGETALARRLAEEVIDAASGSSRWSAQATRARLAWEDGDLAEADRWLEQARGPAADEVRALVAWRRASPEASLRMLDAALAAPVEHRTWRRGSKERARSARAFDGRRPAAALRAFWSRRGAGGARAGAVVDEATYLTSEAAAATDTGTRARALAASTRAALLWERLGQPGRAARAWLARAGALSTIGVRHGADEAAEEVRRRARLTGDTQAAAYALWARVEALPAGDETARAWAIQADAELGDVSAEDVARSAARLLVWAPAVVDDARIAATDGLAPSLSAPAQWEWWGARATAWLAGRRTAGDGAVLAALLALVDAPAPLGSRGPALDAAVRLATERGDGEAARRLEGARQAAARALREGTPPEHRPSLVAVAWARAGAADAADVGFAPAQVAQLESIVRSLSGRERLRPLLEQVLDTLVLWTGVERGLLLLRAPDGRLVLRAARNLARTDLVAGSSRFRRRSLTGPSTRAMPVVATDAFSTFGEVHASVHALGLRSVLAVPLLARGETLGVVYLDDRVRRGAFGAARARVGSRRGVAGRDGDRRRARRGALAPRGPPRGAGPGAARGGAERARRPAGGDANAARAGERRPRDAVPLRRHRGPQRADACALAPRGPRDGERRPGADRGRERHRQGSSWRAPSTPTGSARAAPS